jgi:hypothetical protein
MQVYALDALPAVGDHERLFGAAAATRDMLPVAILVGLVVFAMGAGAIAAGVHFYRKTRSSRPLGGVLLGSLFLLFLAAGAYSFWDFLRTAPWQVRMGDAGVLINTGTPPTALFLTYREIESIAQAEEHYLYPFRSDLDGDLETRQVAATCLDIRLTERAAAAAAQALGTDAEARTAIARRAGADAALVSFIRPARMIDERTLRIQWGPETTPGVVDAVKALSEKRPAAQAVSAVFPATPYRSNPAAWSAIGDADRDAHIVFLVERGMIGAALSMTDAFLRTPDSEERVRALFLRGIDLSQLPVSPESTASDRPATALGLVVRYRPLLTVALFALAVVLTWPAYRNYSDARASADWPTTQGTIVESQRGKPGAPRELFIRFRYMAGGRECESRRISFKGYSGRTWKDLLAQYPLGAEVTVHYSPEAPSRAVLETGFVLREFSTPFFFVEGMGFLLLVLVVLFVVSDPRAKVADQAATAPTRPADTGVGSPAGSEVLPAMPGSQMSGSQIFDVVKRGSTADIRRMFESGANVDARNPGTGETALMAAAAANNLELATFLAARHADPNVVSASGGTALGFAAEQGYTDVVRVLVDLGADVRRLDEKNGLHAAFYAAARGHLEIARLLISRGADIRIRAKNGATALIDAVQTFHEGQWNPDVTLAAAVRFLLDNKVDPAVKDSDGKTALDYAVALDSDPEVIRLLKESTGR